MTPSNLPPHIRTNDPGSYAWHAIAYRHPRIINQVYDTNQMDSSARKALHALKLEMQSGVVTSPFSDGRIARGSFDEAEQQTWEKELADKAGKGWLDQTWYFAEAFFYMKLLVAFGYYDDSPNCITRGKDPYFPQKEKELMDPHGGIFMARQVLAAAASMKHEDAVAYHLQSALWGNRMDLSTFVIDESRRKSVFSSDGDSLIIDHTAAAATALGRAHNVQMILDNAGPELVCDLLLADRLLADAGAGAGGGGARRGPLTVTLHAKKAPFYVSDTTRVDILHTIDVFAADADEFVAAAGKRLREAVRAERLRIRDHWFWTSALHFTAFPADLKSELAAADLLILKGDANYRRILEDRKWPVSACMDKIAQYFPSPFVTVRTMKSEVLVDLPEAKAEALLQVDPEWMVNGKKGLIRCCQMKR